VANGRYMKTKIIQLEQEEGIIVGDAHLKTYITEYYKGLIGRHIPNSFSMDETLRHDIPQVSEEENEMLIAPFSEEQFLTWNITKLLSWMAFLHIFINFFGKL
jgi:hypothetical protein